MTMADTEAFDVDQFDPPPDPDLICCICQGVLNDPVESPCRHVYCRCCIEKWLGNRRNCPNCRKRMYKDQLKPVLPIVQNMINRLTRKCKFFSSGCSKKISLESFVCHIKDCDFEPLTCCFTKCGSTIIRKHLKDHESRCDYREIKCLKLCELLIPFGEFNNHDCVQMLKTRLQEKEKERSELTTEVTEVLESQKTLKKLVDDLMKQMEAYRERHDDLLDASDSSMDSFSDSVTSDGEIYEIDDTADADLSVAANPDADRLTAAARDNNQPAADENRRDDDVDVVTVDSDISFNLRGRNHPIRSSSSGSDPEDGRRSPVLRASGASANGHRPATTRSYTMTTSSRRTVTVETVQQTYQPDDPEVQHLSEGQIIGPVVRTTTTYTYPNNERETDSTGTENLQQGRCSPSAIMHNSSLSSPTRPYDLIDPHGLPPDQSHLVTSSPVHTSPIADRSRTLSRSDSRQSLRSWSSNSSRSSLAGPRRRRSISRSASRSSSRSCSSSRHRNTLNRNLETQSSSRSRSRSRSISSPSRSLSRSRSGSMPRNHRSGSGSSSRSQSRSRSRSRSRSPPRSPPRRRLRSLFSSSSGSDSNGSTIESQPSLLSPYYDPTSISHISASFTSAPSTISNSSPLSIAANFSSDVSLSSSNCSVRGSHHQSGQGGEETFPERRKLVCPESDQDSDSSTISSSSCSSTSSLSTDSSSYESDFESDLSLRVRKDPFDKKFLRKSSSVIEKSTSGDFSVQEEHGNHTVEPNATNLGGSRCSQVEQRPSSVESPQVLNLRSQSKRPADSLLSASNIKHTANRSSNSNECKDTLSNEGVTRRPGCKRRILEKQEPVSKLRRVLALDSASSTEASSSHGTTQRNTVSYSQPAAGQPLLFDNGPIATSSQQIQRAAFNKVHGVTKPKSPKFSDAPPNRPNNEVLSMYPDVLRSDDKTPRQPCYKSPCDSNDSSDSDLSWRPGSYISASCTSDLDSSEVFESDELCDVEVPKTAYQLLNELVNTNDDTDDTWSPESGYHQSP